jgi:hypothetical protein
MRYIRVILLCSEAHFYIHLCSVMFMIIFYMRMASPRFRVYYGMRLAVYFTDVNLFKK